MRRSSTFQLLLRRYVDFCFASNGLCSHSYAYPFLTSFIITRFDRATDRSLNTSINYHVFIQQIITMIIIISTTHCTLPPHRSDADGNALPALFCFILLYCYFDLLLFYFTLLSSPLFYFILFFTLLYLTLFCFILFYFILFHFTSFHFTLSYFMLLYFILFYFTLLYSTLLYSTLL